MLGVFEHRVLLAIARLSDDAYAPEVSRLIEADTGKSVARGALYTTLDRLEKKDMVAWSVQMSSADRDGLPKRRFTVTERGMEALADSRETLLELLSGLNEALGES